MKKILSVLVIISFLFYQTAPSFAALIAADGTTNTTIDSTSNGTPMVNIAAPNSAGLSHNKYSDFNVDEKNLVLNNSKELTCRTQIGDMIPGNSTLINAGVEAHLILNEVTSNRNSSLRGYIEIAGRKADFVLANPNGILVSGAGFINTSRVALVTGTPEIKDGMLGGFSMSQTGSINITGRDAGEAQNLGLDLQNVDFATISSRVINVAGKIYGKTVSLLSGNDKYDYANNTITSKEGVPNSGGVAFGIDSSVLGGMYAGRINIVATENGFGVRTKGDLVANIDDICINSNGAVEFAKADAVRDVNVTAAENITNSDHATAFNDVNLSGKNVSSAKINAGSNINITSAKNTDYNIAEAKAVNIKAGGDITNTGHTIAIEDINLTGKKLCDANFYAGSNIGITTTEGSAYSTAEGNNITVDAGGAITNTGHTTASQNINFKGASLSGADAVFLAGNDISMNIAGDAVYGTAGANQNITINADGGVTNTEQTAAVGNIKLISKKLCDANFYAGNNIDITTTEGAAYSAAEGNNITVDAGGTITNTDHTAALQNINFKGASLACANAGLFAGNDILMNIAGNAAYGTAEVSRNISITAGGDITNINQTNASGNINLSGKNIVVQSLTSGLDTNLTATETLTNNGTVESLQDTYINAGTINLANTKSYLSHRDINLLSANFTNNGNFAAARNANFTINNALNNYAAIQSAGNLSLYANGITNYAGGLLYSGGSMSLGGYGNFTNYGNISGCGSINMNTNGALYFYGSSIMKSNSGISLTGNLLDVQSPSQVLSGGYIGINTSSWFSNAGKTEGAGISSSCGGEFTNNGQLLANNGDLSLSAYRITNNSKMHSDGGMTLTSSTDINNNSNIESDGQMNLTANTLTNNSSVYSDSNLNINLSGTLTNNSEIAAYGDLNLTASGDITNNSSVGLLANNRLTLQANNFYNNANCNVYSGTDSIYKIGNRLQNNQGTIYAGGNLTLRGWGGDSSRAAEIYNTGNVTANTGNLNIQSNSIQNLSINNFTTMGEPGSYGQIWVGLPNEGPWPEGDGSSQNSHVNRRYSYLVSYMAAVRQGKMLAGNDINLYADVITNNSSIITAQNNLNIYANTLYNIRPSGAISYMNYYHERWHEEDGQSWHYESTYTTWTSAVLYSNTPAVLSGKNVNINVTNTAYVDGPSNNLSSLPQNLGTINPKVAAIQSTGILDPLAFPPGGTINAPNINLAPVNAGPINTNSISLTLSAGFEFAQPDQGYLFVNNNRFINVDEFVGSNYFLRHLGYNPDKDTVKFLGDAVYEQKLVENAIVSATGSRYLHDKITNMNDQMTVLYDNAISENKRLGFEIGKDLTQEQVNNLEKDVLWYVQRVVNGYVVLVPMVYLCSATRKTIETGAASGIYAKNEVKIKTNDLANSGKIKGKDVIVDANNNITNLDGTIYADKSLSLKAGGNITNVSSSRTEDYGNGNVRSYMTGNAVIGSGDKLNIEAGKTLNVTAATIASGGDANIKAKDINITTVKLLNSSTRRYGTLATKEKSVTNAGSNISVGGNLALKSENDTTIEGSNVAVLGNADLDIGRNLNIVSAVNTYEKETTQTSTSGGFGGIGEKETKSTEGIKTTANVGSNFNVGKNITVKTGNDATIKGSNVAVAGNADLGVGGNLNIVSVVDTYEKNRSEKSSISGVLGMGDRDAQETEKIKATTQVGSNFSVGGNLNAASKNDINVVASDVNTTKGNMRLDAEGSVNLLAGENTYERTYNREEEGAFNLNNNETNERSYKTKLDSSYALSGKNVKIDADQNINMLASQLGAKGDAELNAENVNIMAGIEKDEYSYSKNERDLVGGVAEISDNQAKVGVKYQETAESHGYANESAKASGVGVGGDLKINTKKDINIVGSDVSADSAELDAAGDINIKAKETKQKSWDAKSETEVKVTVGVGNAAVDAGMAAYELYQAGDAVTKATEALNKATKDSRTTEKARAQLSANLAAATLRLVGATKAAIEAGVSVANSSETMGFYASAGQEYNTKQTRTDTLGTTNRLSSITTRKDLSLASGNNINQIGAVVGSSEGDISYDAANDIAIKAVEDTRTTTTGSSSSQTKLTAKTNGGSFNQSGEESTSRSDAGFYNNSIVSAGNGNVSLKSGKNTSLIGANIVGNSAQIETGGNLTVASVQNTFSTDGESEGYGVGVGRRSGSFNYDYGDFSVKRIWTDNTTTIQTNDSLQIKTNNLDMKGSAIYSQNDNLNITAKKINSEDLTNVDNSEISGFGFGLSFSYNSKGKGSNSKGGSDSGSGGDSSGSSGGGTAGVSSEGSVGGSGGDSGKGSSGGKGSGPKTGSLKDIDIGVRIAFTDKDSVKTAVTKATIGGGTLNVEDKTGLYKINRDEKNITQNLIMKEKIDGALDASFSTKDIKAVGYLASGQVKEDFKTIADGAKDYYKNAQTGEAWVNAVKTGGAPIINTGKIIGNIGEAVKKGEVGNTARLLVGLPMSYLGGDIVDKKLDITPGKEDEKQVLFIGGLWTPDDKAELNAQATKEARGGTVQMNRVGNNAHSMVADVIQSVGYIIGGADITAVNTKDAIKTLADNGNLNAIGYSQGSAATGRALDLLQGSGYKNMGNIYYEGKGPQETINAADYGLGGATNIVSEGDHIPKVGFPFYWIQNWDYKLPDTVVINGKHPHGYFYLNPETNKMEGYFNKITEFNK
ncbi:MAG: hemagglutinin repeat-containing protein [Elusimicrobia bacterium]|nr:hemagglutinin repeat-containing protein [Elusimicrobiota bacterium]